MTLLQYIDRRMASLENGSTSARSVAELRKCRAALAEYLVDRPEASLLEVSTEEFARGYADFLVRERADRQPSTILSYMASFRSLVRHAQKDGFVPGMDFTDDAVKSLKKRLPKHDAAESERTYSITAYPFDGQFRKLLDHFAATDAADCACAPARRHALMYLFGILFYGLEVEELVGLMAEVGEDGKLMVMLPRTSVRVPLSGAALWAAGRYNGGNVGVGRLFELQPGETLVDIDKGISAYLSANGIGLYRSRSIFSDWLARGIELGVTEAMATDLVKSRLSGRFSSEAVAARLLAGQRNANDYGMLQNRWYVLVSYSSKLRGEQMRANVEKSGILRSNPDAKTWDPVDTTVTKRAGKIVKKNSPAVSRYLFVKCSKPQADRVDRLMPAASILRIRGEATRYSTIPEPEILRLQFFLRDFRDEVQLVDFPQWGRENKVALSEGTPVKILSGPFAGFEGKVYRVRPSKGQKPYDSLTIRVNCADTLAIVSKIELDLLDIDVQPITTQSPVCENKA